MSSETLRNLPRAALWLWAVALGLFVAALLLADVWVNHAEENLLAGLGLGISTATSVMVASTRDRSGSGK